jgi:hypothetical protein
VKDDGKSCLFLNNSENLLGKLFNKGNEGQLYPIKTGRKFLYHYHKFIEIYQFDEEKIEIKWKIELKEIICHGIATFGKKGKEKLLIPVWEGHYHLLCIDTTTSLVTRVKEGNQESKNLLSPIHLKSNNKPKFLVNHFSGGYYTFELTKEGEIRNKLVTDGKDVLNFFTSNSLKIRSLKIMTDYQGIIVNYLPSLLNFTLHTLSETDLDFLIGLPGGIKEEKEVVMFLGSCCENSLPVVLLKEVINFVTVP